jgi:uncharacterized protein (DUF433 family)
LTHWLTLKAGSVTHYRTEQKVALPHPSTAVLSNLMSELSTLDLPLYSVALAADYLRMPKTTLGYWLEGGTRKGVKYEPVVRTAPTGSPNLTWGEFVECWYVRQYRRVHDVPMADIRRLIERLREELNLSYPLAHKKPFVAPGKKLALKIQDDSQLSHRAWLVVTEPDGQLGLSTIAEDFLSKVDFADGDGPAIRISPNGRESPVAIQPDVAFGAPHVSGIRTENLAELVDAGEEIDVVAEDFGLTEAELRAALAYEWHRPLASAA